MKPGAPFIASAERANLNLLFAAAGPRAPLIDSDQRANLNLLVEGAGLQPRHSPPPYLGALAPEGIA
jgi:hypothetical protein